MKSIYLAAPWASRDTAKEVRDLFRAEGLEVTSRWLDLPTSSTESDPNTRLIEAQNDFIDVFRADALVLLNFQKRGEETSGKAVETGLALAWGKPIYMYGDTSNVFHYLPMVKRFDNLMDIVREVKNG